MPFHPLILLYRFQLLNLPTIRTFFLIFNTPLGTSVFRERSRLPPQQTQLAEKFLRAIEEEREHEREEEYREELHKLWNRYQKEENGVERELFNDSENNDIESDYPINYDDKKKKRQV